MSYVCNNCMVSYKVLKNEKKISHSFISEDMQTYNHSVNTYRRLGVRLNKLHKELDNIFPFSEN